MLRNDSQRHIHLPLLILYPCKTKGHLTAHPWAKRNAEQNEKLDIYIFSSGVLKQFSIGGTFFQAQLDLGISHLSTRDRKKKI